MTPGLLLLTCVLLTAVAVVADVASHRRRACRLRALASQWQMNFHPADQLRVTPKVLPHLPIPGAANVRVMDLIYGSERERYRYIFSVEFTVGVIGPKRRVVRVASLSEPRERSGGGATSLVLAQVKGTLLDQYRYLAPPVPASARPPGDSGIG